MAPPVQTAVHPKDIRTANRPPAAIPRITPAIPFFFSKSLALKKVITNTASQDESASAGTSDHAAPQDDHTDASDTSKDDELNTSSSIPLAATEGKPVGVGKGTVEQKAAASVTRNAESLTETEDENGGKAAHNLSSKRTDPQKPIDPQQLSVEQSHLNSEPSPNPLFTAPVPHRIIPRELPPPFYPPSEKRSTPTSATSSSFAPPPFHHRIPQMAHQHQPSANGLVFGGYPDSSSTSPAPMSAGYMGYAPAGPTGPPNFAMGPFAPFPMGHSHHGSENHIPNMFQPLSQIHGPAPGPAPWFPAGLNYQPFPIGPMAHQNEIPLDSGTPVSRSTSQSSSNAHETVRLSSLHENGNTGLLALNQQSTPQYENGTPTFSVPPRAAFVPDSMVIPEWLATQFENPEFADHTLEILHDGGITTVPIHALLAARSPCLRELIKDKDHREQPPSKTALPLLKLTIADPFVDEISIKQVLKNLYSGFLPDIHKIASSLPPFKPSGLDYSPVPKDRIQTAVGYASFGAVLGLPLIENHGLETIHALLRLDTVEIPLVAALTDRRDASAAVDPFRRRLLNMLTHYLMSNFPRNFVMDPDALELAPLPRLPSTGTHRPSTSSARLSRIQFGEIPSQPSDVVFAIYSSILLSLPFVVLHDLLGHPTLTQWLGSANMARMMRDVIAKREAQRRNVKESGKMFLSHEDSPQWREVHWEEQVLQTGPHTATLSRKWTLQD